jgi:hypothetical protein
MDADRLLRDGHRGCRAAFVVPARIGISRASGPVLGYTEIIELTLDLPDELSAALGAFSSDLPRAACEAIALEAYRERKLTTAQLRRLLGFESRYELDGFLKQHEVWLDYTWQDVEQRRKTHRQLGL